MIHDAPAQLRARLTFRERLRAFLCPPAPMRVECSWCSRVIRKGVEPVSHGICEDCRAEWDEAAEALTAGRHGGGRASVHMSPMKDRANTERRRTWPARRSPKTTR